MDKLCEAKGTRLVICLIDFQGGDLKSYSDFLSKNNIQFINCVPSAEAGFDRKVKNDGHPSSELNSYWADCIGEYIEKI
jgi:hypothetical protein